MSNERLVSVELEDGCCIITLLRRAKLNALSTALEEELAGAIHSAEASGSRAIVFTGGPDVFSSGADINEMRGLDPSSIFSYYQAVGKVYEDVADLPQPTFSAISGYCLGGGFELALATDFRIADESAIFGLPEVEIGIIPSSGGTYRLCRLAGPARAKELILLRSQFGAAEAFRAGLLTEVVQEGALDRALRLATELSELPPLAVSVAKKVVDRMPESSRDASILIEQLAYGMLSQSSDARDAADAFSDRRKP
jgi:enoyl-CoA hydratase/carnithine racemase